MRRAPIALVPGKANEQHYEVPAAFFAEVLGPHRKYSSCYWGEGVKTLAQAEAASRCASPASARDCRTARTCWSWAAAGAL
jgi:cyclopropane-fatty-acyl-phospholipid synthase